MFIGCAGWLMQKMRKLQQGRVSLSCPAVTPNCPKCTEARCLEKGDGDQGWSTWRGKIRLMTFVGRSAPRFVIVQSPQAKEAVSVAKSEILALQKIIRFGSERSYSVEALFLAFTGGSAKLADMGT